MKQLLNLLFSLLIIVISPQNILFSQEVPLGQNNLVKWLDQELSGESAKRNLEYISTLHRMRGSEGYNQAIEFISNKLNQYHLENIEVIKIPTDGKTMYGTQKSRPAWNVNFAELWELEYIDGTWVKNNLIADWESIPMVVAQDSKTGEAEAELVDIGSGTNESDYIDKNVKGNLVLTSSQPSAVVPLAIEKYGAAGIISYAQNQVSAWWKENENLIRWGHLSTFSNTPAFAFMVSLKQARAFQEKLAKGKKVMLHAKVEAETTDGNYEVLTAVIKGANPSLQNQEILFTCHLDHPRPGANDNTSGCVAILETARTLKKLIDEGKIERPARTLRFLWSPEIEGTLSLLNYKPEYIEKTKLNIHMDMVGGNQNTKAVYHVSRGPMSIPDFANVVGEAFGHFMNESSLAFAGGTGGNYPFVSEEGGREALQAVLGTFEMGSDFQVFTEGSFRIPAIYLHEWPDRYIHTNYDVPANIDPTKLKRSAFLGAVSGYYIADFDEKDIPSFVALNKSILLENLSSRLQHANTLPSEEKENTLHHFWELEKQVFNSINNFAPVPEALEADFKKYLINLQKSVGKGKPMNHTGNESKVVYVRYPEIKGTMSAFGYSYFSDHWKKDPPALMTYSGITGSGGEYAYEALNFVNGKNSVGDIRNWLSAEFGPVPLEMVAEYLQALESIGVIKVLK